MRKIFIILLLFLTLQIHGQQQSKGVKTYSCEQVHKATDIEYALNAGMVKKISLKCSPVGAGESIEVASGRKKDKNYFEKEHNVVWIKFTIGKTGNLTFKIRPISETDDYDFLLFAATGENILQKISSKKLKPIRTNISRNNSEEKGITGLSNSAIKTHTISGVQNNYSKYLPVIKGEEYYLVIDNVYNKGKGAVIYFDYFLNKKISGYIKNKNKENEYALNAEVNWEDAQTGETLIKTNTDSLTGYYEMEVPVDITSPTKKYILSAYTKKHFFAEETFTSKEIIDHNSPSINMLLPKLKKGLRNKLNNINFHGNSPKLLDGAYTSLKRLNKLMKKNKRLTILIEGHTNGCSRGTVLDQKLSENRALTVKNYLVEHGIKEERMKTIGCNCQHMLYPNPKNEKESSLNRRVEILVTEY